MVYWKIPGHDHLVRFDSSQVPMNQFVEHLPWRVAALAGLMVGAISLAGSADVWTSLLRVGGAFLLFGLLGLGLRAALQQGMAVPPGSENRAEERGRHFDQTTPDEPPGEPGNNDAG